MFNSVFSVIVEETDLLKDRYSDCAQHDEQILLLLLLLLSFLTILLLITTQILLKFFQ